MMFVIYRVVNSLTGDSYIGFTTKMNPESRFERHKRNALRGMKFHLYAAMRKYGTENFSFEILEMGENTDYGHKVAEPLYIAWLQPRYNMTRGGDGVVGYVYTEEAKAAIHKGMIGKTHNQERKLSNSL
jgi:group I intron endonuclease